MLVTKLTTMAAGVMVAGLLTTGAVTVGVQLLPETPAAQQPGDSTKKSDGKMEEHSAVLPGRELPPAVRQALESNARALAPIVLTIEKQRSFSDPQMKEAKEIQAGLPGVLKPYTYVYLAQDGLCYARFNKWVQIRNRIGNTDKGTDPFLSPVWQEFAWDGKCAFRGNQSAQPMILEVVPIEKAESDFLGKVPWYEEDDYLGMIGIAVPRFMKELARGPQSEILRLLEDHGRVTAVASKRLPGQTVDYVVVELRSQDTKNHRFWLDPALRYAVRRHEIWTTADAMMLVIDNSDFIKLTDPELWLPRHCHTELNHRGTRTIIVAELQATRLDRTHVAPEQFTLKYQPGSFVSDARVAAGTKGRVGYITPENPADIKGVVQAASEGQEYVPSRSFVALWVVGSGLAILIVSFIIAALSRLRRRDRLKSTPGTNAAQEIS